LGKNGIEKIIILDLNEGEQKLLEESSAAVKSVMAALDDLKL